jgi:hypothetical protein
MLTLFGSLLGFLGSIFPDLFSLFKNKYDQAHELALFDRQIKLQRLTQTHEKESTAKLLDTMEMQAIYHHAQPTSVKWIDALSGSVRPFITYTFFLLYAGVKLSQGLVMVHVADELSWAQVLVQLWHEEDQALFAAVMSFWFGQRSFRKTKIRG